MRRPPKLQPLNCLCVLLLLISPSVFANDRLLESIRVPDDYSVDIAAPIELAPYPMCGTFDDRGRLYITASNGEDKKGADAPENPVCMIYRLVDADGDGHYESSTVFADKLSLPMGAQYLDGSLYVASPPELLKFTDSDDDGVADTREMLLEGWNIKNTASLHGPFLGPDGWLYMTHGRHGYEIMTKEGELLEGDAARIWRCRPDGTELERVCGGGFDNPIEIAFTPAGEMIGTMTYFTDPKNGQRDGLMHWVEGGVYPKPHKSVDEFVRTGELLPPMTKFARIAPSGIILRRNFRPTGDQIGELFTAQFNPHRVQRHELFRDHSTFRTRDEDFLVSSDPDFHPTDVIEDADGSLIVLETGGWYVDACPISQISKPEIKGSILRVRQGEKRVDDAWGMSIDFENASPKELAELLADPRFAVSDRAGFELESRGTESVNVLGRIVNSAKTTEVRCQAVWVLMRIDAPQARAVIRKALWDPEPEVRSAAARACGRAADKGALAQLMHLARYDEPQVRRAASEALSRLKSPKSTRALLHSAALARDPFARHSATDALIKIHADGDKPAAALLKAIRGVETWQPGAIEAALIALDQVGKLKRSHFAAFANECPPGLESTALWVASRHPEWASEAGLMIESMVTAEVFETEQEEIVREAIASFHASEPIQERIANLITGEELDEEFGGDRRIFLINCLTQTPGKDLPDLWVEALRTSLEAEDESIIGAALSVIQTRQLAALHEAALDLAGDEQRPAELRLAALGAALSIDRQLGRDGFEFVLDQLESESAPRRLAAAQRLARAELSANQLTELAERALSGADALTLPSMLMAFEATDDESVITNMIGALVKNPAAKNEATGSAVERLIENYSPKVHAAAAPLLEQAEMAKAQRVEKLEGLAPLLAGGDVGRGRKVFFSSTAACSTCHAIGTEGGSIGPDLTSIGEIRSGRDILEAVVFPNSTIVPGYEPMRVDTDFESYSGILGEQTTESILLKTGAGAVVRLMRDEIESIKPSTVSLMPEGLEAAVTQSELADLLAFLQAQNGDPWLSPTVRSDD